MTEEPDRQAPQEWVDRLARSRADLAAGRTVSGDGLMRRLRQTIADMQAEAEAESAARTAQPANPR